MIISALIFIQVTAARHQSRMMVLSGAMFSSLVVATADVNLSRWSYLSEVNAQNAVGVYTPASKSLFSLLYRHCEYHE